MFKDQFGTPYAAVRTAEVHVETLPLKDSRFKNWLSRMYYESENHKDLLNNENITNVLNVLKAKAEFDGITRKLDVRVASLEGEPNISQVIMSWLKYTEKNNMIPKLRKDCC